MKKILKNWHLAINSFTYPLLHGKLMGKFITFTDSCRYDIGKEQKDWNKLFGFSLGFFPLYKQYMQHENSVRFGWRYNPEKDCIEITPYIYKDGERMYAEKSLFETANLKLNEEYSFTITILPKNCVFIIIGPDVSYLEYIDITFKKQSNFGFHAPLYFGGNDKAPHDIKILMKNGI